jgi:hypothetical protein
LKRNISIKLQDLPIRERLISGTDMSKIFGGCFGSGSTFQHAEAVMFAEIELCKQCCSGKCSKLDTILGYKDISGTCK